MKPKTQSPESDFQLNIVGGNLFGRNPKMSSEQTFNMMISDEWLVQTPGYKKSINIPGKNVGRGIYSSERGGFMIAVIDNAVFKIYGPSTALSIQQIFSINTFFGNVTIAENINAEIAICDGFELWIYNYNTGVSQPANLPNSEFNPSVKIKPGYVDYHDGYFIVPDVTSNLWYLSKVNDGLVWNWGAASPGYVFGAIQTKPDSAVAVLRAPGKGNLIYVFGRTVTEMWYDNGNQIFPYQRTNSVSVDYGCISSATIAAMDEYVAWLGANEKSGPVIMISAGGGFTHISNDGIDFKLDEVVSPESSYGFFYKIDGHVFYQLTFYDPSDNFTLIYDFNTQKFFYLTDENMNYHIAESVAFYNNTYYFLSINDGSLYEMNSKYTTYDYNDPTSATQYRLHEIPRMRVCNNAAREDTSRFIGGNLTFTIEQGNDPYYIGPRCRYLTTEGGKVLAHEAPTGYVGDFLSNESVLNEYVPRVDLTVSKDGGESYGNTVSQPMHPQANRKNKMIFWRMGASNDLTAQFRFWSRGRITVSNGIMQARQ